MRFAVAALAALTLTCVAAPAQAAPKGSATGAVWLDMDADGVRDAGDGGVSGLKVQLQRKAGKRWRTVAKPKTSKNGEWTARRLRPGRYRIALALPAVGKAFSPRKRDSDMQATGRSTAVRLRGGKRIRLDAGVIPKDVAPPPVPSAPAPAPAPPPAGPAVVAGVAWHDTDADGVRDPGEAGRAGVVLELWNAVRNESLATATSDLDGRWSITAPAAGGYRLRHVLSDGTFYSPNDTDSAIHDDGDNAGFTDLLTVNPGTLPLAVGVRTPAAITIGDFWWRDDAATGVQTGWYQAGVVALVELWNDSLTQRLAVAAHGVDDRYSLPARARSVYRVRFVNAGTLYGFSPRDAGASDALDSDVERFGPLAGVTGTLRLQASTVNVDAGRVNRASIGNLVWRDDNDGRQEAGEPGVAGATVELWDESKSIRYETATTNATGAYAVKTPFPGDFLLRFLLPPGALQFAPYLSPPDDLLDSDAGSQGWSQVITVNNSVISTTKWDAGVVFP